MKSTCAKLLSLLLMLAQVVLSAGLPADSGSTSRADHDSCCPKPGANCCACCVASPEPGQLPLATLPASPGPTSPATHFVLFSIALWTLPNHSAVSHESSPDSSVATQAIPLFQRNCALLI